MIRKDQLRAGAVVGEQQEQLADKDKKQRTLAAASLISALEAAGAVGLVIFLSGSNNSVATSVNASDGREGNKGKPILNLPGGLPSASEHARLVETPGKTEASTPEPSRVAARPTGTATAVATSEPTEASMADAFEEIDNTAKTDLLYKIADAKGESLRDVQAEVENGVLEIKIDHSSDDPKAAKVYAWGVVDHSKDSRGQEDSETAAWVVTVDQKGAESVPDLSKLGLAMRFRAGRTEFVAGDGVVAATFGGKGSFNFKHIDVDWDGLDKAKRLDLKRAFYQWWAKYVDIQSFADDKMTTPDKVRVDLGYMGNLDRLKFPTPDELGISRYWDPSYPEYWNANTIYKGMMLTWGITLRNGGGSEGFPPIKGRSGEGDSMGEIVLGVSGGDMSARNSILIRVFKEWGTILSAVDLNYPSCLEAEKASTAWALAWRYAWGDVKGAIHDATEGDLPMYMDAINSICASPR